jgi:hypothetical protein
LQLDCSTYKLALEVIPKKRECKKRGREDRTSWIEREREREREREPQRGV